MMQNKLKMKFYVQKVNWVGVAVLLCVGISVAFGENEAFQVLQRRKRGMKDALPKDDEFSQSGAIVNMRHKIFSLENSIKTVNCETEKLSRQNSDLHKEMVEQLALIESLREELTVIQGSLSSHSNSLSDLVNIVSPDDNLFALSNQTCGGVLVSQSGSIVFNTIAALRGVRYPSSCIWTIRANNREQIKISTNYPYRSYTYTYRQHAQVVELIKSENNTVSTRVTQLQKNMHHVFSGPLLFVVYPLGPQNDDYPEVELHLQYEGMGKLVEKDVFFSHEILTENSGNFSDTQLKTWRQSFLSNLPVNANYTDDYTTIVVSNFSTKVHLQAVVDTQACSKGYSFIVITELLESETAFKDCCKTLCDGNNSLINYDNPFVILIKKKFKDPMSFRLMWVAETPYPSSSRPVVGSLYGHKCGEVLGGVSGSILYKAHVAYRNGERCIWVIVPQPRPRASIVVSVGANGVENTYDHLYMIELTDVNGTTLEGGPNITRLGRYGAYEAHSRELYIVFYSDSSVTGYGFSLSWKTSGDVVKTGNGDVTTRFTIFKGDDGAAQSRDVGPLLTNGIYEVFILTPIVPYAYVFGMQLHINQTRPVPGPSDCINEDIKVYTALDGLLSKTDIECNYPGKTIIENADGLAMIVLDNQNVGSNVAMNFSWKQEYGDGNDTYVVVDNSHCGGVIKGRKGILKYKISFDYLNNERCVWLLQSPNSTSITLKLLKDGFEACCDHILVNTIEPTNATLRNDTVIINRTNRTRTFNESVLVIVFRSDGSTRGRGFALQFTANGQVESPSPYRYQLRHHNEPFGTVAYPSSEWEDAINGTQDIFLVASSIKIGIDEDPLIMPTNVSWVGGVFKDGYGNCTFDSLTFYATPDPDGWKERNRYPNENDTFSCPSSIQVPKKDDIFSTIYSAFLAIYKPLRSFENEESAPQSQRSRMEFMFEKSAGCGGVIIGDSGEIRYKEEGRYLNLEKCVWLVHAPQADRIRFWLERSGFEDCCDLLTISTIDRTHGIPHQTSMISQFNRTAVVDGPVVIVSFVSDSSVVGEGFRLSFSTETKTTSNFPYIYHLEHKNLPKHNNFVYQVEPNEIVIIAFSPEIHRQTYQGLGKTEITVASLRPQVDTECHSDTLTIYDVGKEKMILTKSFSAMDVVRDTIMQEDVEGNCTALRDSDYHPCDDILDCGDTPENNVFYSNSTSFLAVYRSVNATDDLKYRGFVMYSTTTFPTLSSSSD